MYAFRRRSDCIGSLFCCTTACCFLATCFANVNRLASFCLFCDDCTTTSADEMMRLPFLNSSVACDGSICKVCAMGAKKARTFSLLTSSLILSNTPCGGSLGLMSSTTHHARALQLLSSLDEARKQRDNNEELRNSLLDAEDTLNQLYKQFFQQRMFKDVSAAKEAADSKLKFYEEQLSYSATSKRHHSTRYMADCGLLVPQEKLSQDDANGSTRAIDLAVNKLHQIRSSNGATKTTDIFFEDAIEKLERAARLVDAAKIESDQWLPVIEPVLNLLEEISTCKSVGEPLKDIVTEVQKLASVEEDLARQQDNSADNGNLAESEGITMQRITVLEGISDLITEKFRLLDREERENIDKLVLRVSQVREGAASHMSEFRGAMTTRKRGLEDDVQKLIRESKKAKNDEETARVLFLEEKERSDMLLSQNSEMQLQWWERIFEAERELSKLATQRREEIDRRVKMVEREERRRVDIRNFTDFASSHSNMLSSTLRSCEVEESVGSVIEELANNVCSESQLSLSNIERELDALRGDALQEHLLHFRKQYLTVGDLIYKKDRYIDELNKRSEFVVLQQEMAMDSLNPKAKVFSQQRGEIECEKKAVQQVIDVLKEKSALYVESFKPTEAALAARGKTFVHPLHELAAMNKEKGRKLAEYYSLMITQHAPNKDKQTILHGASPHELQTQRDDIEEQRQQHVLLIEAKKIAAKAAAMNSNKKKPAVAPKGMQDALD